MPDHDGGIDPDGTGWGPEAVARLAAVEPDRVAVVSDDEVLTYGDLHRRSVHLARGLVRRGTPGDRVLLRHDGLPALAVATLAVAHAAMVTVLVDPTEPEARVVALAELVGAIGLLTDLPWTVDGGPTVVEPHGSLPGLPQDEAWVLAVEPAPEALASIAFTSGSTGEPKGIMLPVEERQTVGRFLTVVEERTGTGRHLGLPFVGSAAGVDGALHSMFLLGSTIHSFDVRRRGLHEIEAWLVDSHIDAFSAVPTAFRFLLTLIDPDRTFPELRLVASFGEPLPWDLVADLRRHLSPDAVIVNVFGLTEARSVSATRIDPDDPLGEGLVPAGRPLPGMEVTIVDPTGADVLTGEVGEIVVAGDSCGLGYWGLPELSATVFDVRPDGRRRVRTGDAGRLLSGGVLEQTGRLDHVVKVAGNRVDLAEVEAALLALPEVANGAVVQVADRHGELRLRAAVVARPGRSADPAELRRALQRSLSRWSVPDLVQLVDDLPTLASGKVDRQALAATLGPDHDHEEAEDPVAPEGGDAEAATAEPGEEASLEQRLLALWRAELERPDLGLDDDFFDAGGDSLRAARLFVEIDEVLGLDRPISLLVHHRTVRTLAAVLRLDRGVWDVLVPIRTTGDRPPLFVVHGGYGEVLFALPLAEQLGPDQPVYALRAEALDGYPPRVDTVEALAAGYVAHLRSVRPEGPYALYGFSLGGQLAFEMAVQLQAAGAEVVLLALGDARLPGAPPRAQRVVDRLRRHAGALRGAGIRGAATHLAALGRRQLANLDRRLHRARTRQEQLRHLEAVGGDVTYPVPVELRRDHVLLHYGTLVDGHRPTGRFQGRLLHLRAELSTADRGWADLATEGVEVVPIRGRHPQMEVEPGLGDVARALRRALDALAPSSDR